MQEAKYHKNAVVPGYGSPVSDICMRDIYFTASEVDENTPFCMQPLTEEEFDAICDEGKWVTWIG